MSPPQVVAHRGYASRYPENTLIALRAAVEAGARWVEFDVQLSADAIPLLLHDVNLARTTGLALDVRDTDWEKLRTLSAGEPARFGGRFDNEPLPSLEQAVDWLTGRPGIGCFVEIKTESVERHGVTAVLDAVLARLGPLAGRVTLISYHSGLLSAVRSRGDWPVGQVLERWNEAGLRAAAGLAPEFLIVNWRKLPVGPAPLPAGVWQWMCYEVTEAALAMDLARRGVRFVETMRVGELVAALEQRP